ncbi:MAG: SAM-dependent methyltransferase, partial [Ferruginibacter sp.]|nr:SAM-dependent methyltransferase [Cytophagales bacterium]
FQRAGLTLLHTFGNYRLAPYDPLVSERMIFVLQKS